MEMLEDKLSPYIFNHSSKTREVLANSIEDLTYLFLIWKPLDSFPNIMK
jgi:hypothetical protein